MSKKKSASKAEKIEKKKQQILAAQQKNTTIMTSVMVLVGIIVIVGVLFLDFSGDKKAESKPQATTIDTSSSSVEASETDAPAADSNLVANAPRLDEASNRVSYPVSTFQDGEAKYYEYPTDDGINIRYFILKSADGVIRAAFDACDVCWQAGKGYEQAGDMMTCRNCGLQFASNKINEVQGGCNPAPLKREIVDNELVINVDDILTGRQYFNLGGRG